MKTKWAFTSKQFVGTLTFGYDDEDVLIEFQNEAELSLVQQQFLRTNFPFVRTDLEKILGSSGTIREVIDISFDRFWTEYDKKVNKKRAEKLFYTLSETNRQLCIDSLKKYKSYCKSRNRELKDPDTYIRNDGWLDELWS